MQMLMLSGMVASAVAFLLVIWKKIPHPAEFEFIGRWFRLAGWHKHLPYDLIFEFGYVQLSSKKPMDFYITVESGRFEESTQVCTSDAEGKINVFERVTIRLRQMDNACKLFLFRRGTLGLTKTQVGQIIFTWDADLSAENFPRDKAYHWCSKDGKRTIDTLTMSLNRVEALRTKPLDPLDQMAIIEARKRGLGVTTLDDMPIEKRIEAYANCIEGPLDILRPLKPPKTFFFKAQRLKNGKYTWMIYPTREAMERKEKHTEHVPFLSISLVLADPSNRHQFYVKYLTKDGVRELFLRRVDRDRDLWSEGLYGFIEKYRAYLHETKTAAAKLTKAEKEEAEKEPAFSRAAYEMMLEAEESSEDETAVLLP